MQQPSRIVDVRPKLRIAQKIAQQLARDYPARLSQQRRQRVESRVRFRVERNVLVFCFRSHGADGYSIRVADYSLGCRDTWGRRAFGAILPHLAIRR